MTSPSVKLIDEEFSLWQWQKESLSIELIQKDCSLKGFHIWRYSFSLVKVGFLFQTKTDSKLQAWTRAFSLLYNFQNIIWKTFCISDRSNWDFTSAGMSNVIKYVFLIIEISEFITGICGNGFIALVLCADSLKSKTISLLDFIFTCLAISRIGMVFILLLDGIRIVFHPEILDSHQVIEVTFDFFWNLSNSLATWCAACLSIFYFLKLSSFSHPFFLWLKWRRNRVVFTIMLGFCLSLFFNLLNIKFNTLRVSDHLEIENNLTWEKCMPKTQYYSSQILLHLGSLIPLAVSLILFFLLIFSLWRHTRQMTRHAKGSKDLNTGVLVTASLDEGQAGIKIAGEISTTSHMETIPL